MYVKQRAVSAVVLCALLATGLTACGSSATTASSAGSPSASASASPTGPLDDLTGSQIATKAFTNLQEASSVRFSGQGTTSDGMAQLAATVVRGQGCKGTMKMAGHGSIKVEIIGATMWLNGDRTFWRAYGDTNPAVLGMLANKWIKTSKSGKAAAIGDICDLKKQLSETAGDPTTIKKGGTSTVAGQPALELSNAASGASAYVSISATPMLLRITTTGSDAGSTDFSDYNVPVSLTPPPASETVNGSLYGM